MKEMYIDFYIKNNSINICINIFYNGELYQIHSSQLTFMELAQVINSYFDLKELKVDIYMDVIGCGQGLYNAFIELGININKMKFNNINLPYYYK